MENSFSICSLRSTKTNLRIEKSVGSATLPTIVELRASMKASPSEKSPILNDNSAELPKRDESHVPVL